MKVPTLAAISRFKKLVWNYNIICLLSQFKQYNY